MEPGGSLVHRKDCLKIVQTFNSGKNTNGAGAITMVNSISRKEVRDAIVAMALRDEEFRESLLANPKSAVERALGKTLDDGLEVYLLQEDEETMYIVLPKELAPKNEELSDFELETVAGGYFSLGTENLFSQPRKHL
jgi:hypothetical protein